MPFLLSSLHHSMNSSLYFSPYLQIELIMTEVGVVSQFSLYILYLVLWKVLGGNISAYAHLQDGIVKALCFSQGKHLLEEIFNGYNESMMVRMWTMVHHGKYDRRTKSDTGHIIFVKTQYHPSYLLQHYFLVNKNLFCFSTSGALTLPMIK